MENSSNQDRPRRRDYSKQFKAEVLARYVQPGASVGGVALAHGPTFVSLPIATAPCSPALNALPAQLPAPAEEEPLREVHLQIQRGELLVRLQCPLSQCGSTQVKGSYHGLRNGGADPKQKLSHVDSMAALR